MVGIGRENGSHWNSRGARKDLRYNDRRLGEQIRELPQVRALLLLDSGGTAINASTPEVIGVNFGQRPWFVALRQNRPLTARGPQLGAPEPGWLPNSGQASTAREMSGQWTLPVARAQRTDEIFVGAAVALLDPEALVRAAEQVALSFSVDVRILSTQAVLLAGSSPAVGRVGQVLVPTLRRGDVVVFDNLTSHFTPGVFEAIKRVGASVLPLPPYSPDFNPIEEMFSKFKGFLRHVGVRAKAHLYDAIRDGLRQVTPQDILGWFRHAGKCVMQA